MLPEPLEIVALVLASARVTRLITHDSIFTPVRQWVLIRAERHSIARLQWWDELLSCPWCTGMWVSFAATAGWLTLPRETTLVIASTLALAYLVGVLEEHL